MSNPFLQMVNETGKRPYQLLESELKGVIADATFYSLVNSEDKIPDKTQWLTISKVAEALGYKIEFIRNGE